MPVPRNVFVLWEWDGLCWFVVKEDSAEIVCRGENVHVRRLDFSMVGSLQDSWEKYCC